MNNSVAIFWFRRDLRMEDNAGFSHALKGKHPVLPIFIFDREILDELPELDPRVSFIFDTIQKMNTVLQAENGSSLAVFYGKPLELFKKLLEKYPVAAVYTNHDYEPYATQRDQKIRELLEENEIPFRTYKDQVIFEKDEVVKEDGDPYVVYTPYMKKWKEVLGGNQEPDTYQTRQHLSNLVKNTALPNISLKEMGFSPSNIAVPDFDISPALIANYEKTRNIPSEEGTSRLGPHLRFGTISIRKILKKALATKNDTFCNELIWREFFMQILWHFPESAQSAFKKKYDRIPWRNNNDEFEKWKTGTTGYALVDAGMRQLNSTGYMHNRVRMVTASFLCKHLLIDWRWGEAYFAEKLLDYEMSSNVGNWQWASGSGVDAAPYFRIFNPMTQVEKFDKDQRYIKQWIPEFGTADYSDKMVDHKEARERCLETYKLALD